MRGRWGESLWRERTSACPCCLLLPRAFRAPASLESWGTGRDRQLPGVRVDGAADGCSALWTGQEPEDQAQAAWGQRAETTAGATHQQHLQAAEEGSSEGCLPYFHQAREGLRMAWFHSTSWACWLLFSCSCLSRELNSWREFQSQSTGTEPAICDHLQHCHHRPFISERR